MNTELQALYEQDQADRSAFFEQLDTEQLKLLRERPSAAATGGGTDKK